MPSLVVVGTSLGGLRALRTVLAGLPSGFPLPIVVAQHRQSNTEDLLAQVLEESCSLAIGEPCDKDAIVPGRVYLAPPDYHLLVEGATFALSTEGPVLYSRPSIDVLFESTAVAQGPGVIGVVLTGATRDGAQGAAMIKRRGGIVIVQDPATAESAVMPEAALAATTVDAVLPLEEIAPFLVGLGRKLEAEGRG